jgi:hypothetical protein
MMRADYDADIPVWGIARQYGLSSPLSLGAQGLSGLVRGWIVRPTRVDPGEADGAGSGGRAGGYEGRRRRTDCPYF